MNKAQFFIFAIMRSIRHPRSPVTYYYCPDCRVRFQTNERQCPKCHKRVSRNPEVRQQSPIPWYGSVLVIIIGIICWITGAVVGVPGLDEAGHALVYIPLGSLFGVTLRS